MLTRFRLALVCALISFGFVTGHAEARVTYSGGSSAFTNRGCLTASTRALLSRIEGRFGTVQIVSTCRPGATIRNTGKRSKHASGQAVDFIAPSGKKGDIVKWLIANHRGGGTMTYPGMNHIHVDVGYRFVSLAGRRMRA